VIGSPDMVDIEGALGRWLADHDARAILLRPDFYIYGTAKDRHDVTPLIAELRAAFEGDGRATARCKN
jgi:hypothetical protein